MLIEISLILYYIFWTALAYFTYLKCIMMYYRYFFYKLQGIQSIGFPLPFIANMLQMLRALKYIKESKFTLLEAYWYTGFN